MHVLSPLLAGLDPVRLFDRATDQPERTDPGTWQPPPVAEVAREFPALAVAELIGRGGMGAVYRATQRDIEREVALKLLPPELSGDPAFAERFRREATLMASLSHPGLVSVFEFGETASGLLFYVMEFLAGGDLAQLLQKQPLTPHDAVPLIDAISAAVAVAHAAGIVHRDLKPANILLTLDGKPKVADFGLARPDAPQSALSRLTQADVALGTVGYAAPEQLVFGSEPTPAADVYSLGVIAYEVLTKSLPAGVFDAPSKLNAEVDPAFDAVIFQALQSDPARRFANAGAFREAWLRAADLRLQQQLREREARAKLLRRTRLAFAFGGVAFIALAAAAYGWVQQREAQRQAAKAIAGRASAEHLVGMVIDEMHGKLVDTGRVDLLESVDAEVQRYYDRLPAEDWTDDTRTDQARFLQRHSVLLRMKGDWAGALDHAERAAAMLLPRAQAMPSDVDRFTDAATALSTISYIHRLQRDTMNGLASSQRLLDFVEQAVPHLPPSHTSVAFYQSRAWRRVGDQLLLLERFDEARRHFERADAAVVPLIASGKAGRDLFTEVALARSKLGDLSLKQSRFDEAIRWYQAAIEAQLKTEKKGQWRLDTRSTLQAYYAFLAEAQQKNNDHAAAKPWIEKAGILMEEIGTRSPGSTDHLEAQRYYYRTQGEDLRHDGKTHEANAVIRLANEAYAKWKKLKGTPVIE